MTAQAILVSGWRFLPHSYSVICQSLCLEFLQRPGLQLYFEDLPYYSPNWRPMAQMFSAEADARLRGLQPPAPGTRLDAELRFGYPMDLLRPPRASRTTVFATIEAQKASPYNLPEGLSAGEAQSRHDFPILTCSNWSKEGLLNSGVREDRVALVSLGFDPAVFRPATPALRRQCRAELDLAGDDFVFFHAGAMTPNKGMYHLLAAFAQVLELRPQALLLLKGTDALYTSRQFLEQQLQALGRETAEAILQRIRYVGGELPFEGVARLYQAADCYASAYLAEAFNIPVLEAAACGLPVICTGGGSTDDFVSDSFALRIESIRHPLAVTGLPDAIGLLPDIDHLVHLMICAVDDAEFRAAARAAGPQFVNPRFTWASVVDQLLPCLLEGRLQ